MALTINKVGETAPVGSDLRECIVQVNAIADLLRAWAVTMDADAGITATNFVSTLEAAVEKIGDRTGTAIS